MINPKLDARYRQQGLWKDTGLYDIWRSQIAEAGDGEAVVDSRGFRASYAQIDRQTARLAGFLRQKGVGRGDVVTALLPNRGEYLVVNIACLKLGAILHCVLPQHRFTELVHQVGLCGSAALIMTPRHRRIDHVADVERLVSIAPYLRTVVVIGEPMPDGSIFTSYEQALTSTELPDAECTPAGGNDIAVILFTSGSEAKAKGVLLTHNNVMASEQGFIDALGLSSGERMMMPAPIAHATGYLHGMTMPLMIGGTSALLDGQTGADAVRFINDEKCTCTMGSTTIIRDIVDAAVAEDGFHPGLHRICCGGAPVPRRLVQTTLDLGVTIHSVYGSTESAPHTMTRPTDPITRVVNTDGRAVPNTQVRIVDPVTRQTLPAGQEGEEASQGPAVFSGYLGDMERTAAVLDEDGWYYSGDIAVMDDAGYIRIIGRIKDTIVRGGENIAAREVEEILLQHPKISDVAVVAMPDPRLGEKACAFVVARPGVEAPTLQDIQNYFVEMEVARYKTPERVEIIEALPLTATGKVCKADLRQQIAAMVAAETTSQTGNSRG